VSALLLPSRTGRRSEREFLGHAGGVLSSLPGFALAEPGLASLLALFTQFPSDESLGYFLSPFGLGWPDGKRFLRNSTFLRQHVGVKKRLLMANGKSFKFQGLSGPSRWL
jgi:hypothetical protein